MYEITGMRVCVCVWNKCKQTQRILLHFNFVTSAWWSNPVIKIASAVVAKKSEGLPYMKVKFEGGDLIRILRADCTIIMFRLHEKTY
jgi:hypothetical protein